MSLSVSTSLSSGLLLEEGSGESGVLSSLLVSARLEDLLARDVSSIWSTTLLCESNS